MQICIFKNLGVISVQGTVQLFSIMLYTEYKLKTRTLAKTCSHLLIN